MGDVSFSLEDIRAILAAAKIDNADDLLGQHVENMVRDEALSVLETKKVLKAKRAGFVKYLWETAEKISDTVPVTKGDGKNRNTSKDRHMIRVPFPKGEIAIAVYLNDSVESESSDEE